VKAGSKKPSSIEDIKKQAESSRIRKGEIHNVDDDMDDEDFESLQNHIYMEL
jgi:hypothetical protein